MMDGAMGDWIHLAFRWIHVVAGVLWIGLLYFFNWVNGSFAKTLDADTKRKVMPELLPRTLFFFRWGAAYTWVTGIILLALVYYMKGEMGEELSAGAGMSFGLGIAIVGTLVYHFFWKFCGKNETVAVIVSFVGVIGVLYLMNGMFPPRATYIHLGALFGTAMAFNVWMQIWPAQQKIITAIKEGNAPDPALVARAGLRSKHNTYMSVPLIFIMVSNHYPAVYGADGSWTCLALLVAIGWFVTWAIYKKAAKVPGF